MRTALVGARKNAGIPYGEKVENGLVFRDLLTTSKTNMPGAGVNNALRDTILGHRLKGMDAYDLKPTATSSERQWTRSELGIDAHLADVT